MNRFFVFFFAAILSTATVALALETVNESVFTPSNTTVGVRTGQDFLIALRSNATTGYGWAVTVSGNSVAVEGSAYQGSQTRPVRMGAGGQQIFVLEARHPGISKVTFNYRRAFDKNAKPAQTVIFTIVVTK